jgi:hypothetical protein
MTRICNILEPDFVVFEALQEHNKKNSILFAKYLISQLSFPASLRIIKTAIFGKGRICDLEFTFKIHANQKIFKSVAFDPH